MNNKLTKNKSVFSLIEVILAGVLWGCMGLFVRNLGTLGLETMSIVAIRGFVVVIILFIYMIIFRRKLFRIKLKDIWCFLGTGVLSVLFFNYCYFRTMTVTSLSVAAILLYTSPAFIMILSYFLFKEKFGKNKIIALVMTFVGCAFVSGLAESLISGDLGNMSLTPLNLLIGLGAGLGYALYSIFSRYAIERGYDSLTITFYTFLFASAVSLFIPGTDLTGMVAVFTGSVKGALLCIGIGTVVTLIPYLAYTAGLKGMDNGKAGVVVSIEPAVATLVSLIVYKEKMSVFGAIGVVLVLGAIIIVNIGSNRNKAENS